MRIDNHMGGLRPPAAKQKKALNFTNSQVILGGGNLNAPLGQKPVDDNTDECPMDNPKQYVHKRNRLEKAALGLGAQGEMK